MYDEPAPDGSPWYSIRLGSGDVAKWAARTTTYAADLLHASSLIKYLPEP